METNYFHVEKVAFLLAFKNYPKLVISIRILLYHQNVEKGNGTSSTTPS